MTDYDNLLELTKIVDSVHNDNTLKNDNVKKVSLNQDIEMQSCYISICRTINNQDDGNEKLDDDYSGLVDQL